METLTISELISSLQSSFRDSDMAEVERILVARVEALRSQIARTFSEELMVKGVEGIERDARIRGLEGELSALRSRCALLEKQINNRGEGVGSEMSDKGKNAGFGDVESGKIVSLESGEGVRVLGERERSEKGEDDVWKRRCEELEARVLKLEEENLKLRAMEQERCQRGKALGGIVEISDSDSESDDEKCPKDHGSKESKKMMILLELEEEADIEKKSNSDSAEDDFGGRHAENVLPVPTPNRKRGSRVIISDSESETDDYDDDDTIPIAKLKRKKLNNEVIGGIKDDSDDIQEDFKPSKRRLVRLKKCSAKSSMQEENSPEDAVSKDQPKKDKPATNRKLKFLDVEEDKEEDGSESKGESLSGFIVSESENLESSSGSDDNPASEEEKEEEEGSDVDLDDVLANIRRGKNSKKWEYEADMLSAFSNNRELCLKAVCALYRQQTLEEQSMKTTFIRNKRGFNHLDAGRGSLIAEFLMDGDRYGPVKKTVRDLDKYNPQGSDFCYKLARRYSKQLFMIYQNNEDPYFHPS